MNKENEKHERFVEQDAPRKNTDRAFVKVGKDGAPDFPGKDKKENRNEEGSRRDWKEDDHKA